MVATYDHDDLDLFMYITCPATGEDIYPNQAQGDAIMISVENDFISRTGLAIVGSNAKHVQLCKWITELEYRKWAISHQGAADSHSTPGGSYAHSNRGYTFTWEQFDNLVAEIVGGTTKNESASMVDAENNADGFTSF